MKKTIEDVINYIKKETPNFNPQDKPNISRYYRELSTLINKRVKKSKNPNFEKYWEKSWKDEVLASYGAEVYLYKDDLYIEDIKEISISHLYPKAISLIYHNTDLYDDLSYYIFIVDNLETIKEKLVDNELILLKIFINYFYGYLVRYKPMKSNYMIYFVRKFVQSIINDDSKNLRDIVYVDTDSFFICNTKEGNEYLKSRLLELFDNYNEEIYYSVLFNKKKHLIYFDKEPYKIKGVRPNIFFKDKQLKNATYLRYNKNLKLSFGYFFMNKHNPDIVFQKEQTRREILRLKKLNRILDDN